MPKAMFAPVPPRRTSSPLARNDSDTLLSCSASSESANRPSKVNRWSVAMDPATAVRILRTLLIGRGWVPVGNSLPSAA